jgi:outer membrane receptor for ferrienterochelin and colicins
MLVLAGVTLLTDPSRAQEAAPVEPAAAAAPVAAPQAVPAAAPATLERVEVTGGRTSDGEERRQSTAAKIVVGRDEIERYGDSTVGELLKRLPGVTMQGAPGRGGAIRMRGLGGGYTQILLDGERVPPGFSLDSLTPEQVERIEILRAPTAETGTRAIAGTINIITREGLRKRINDLKFGVALEGDQLSPGLSWTRNDSLESMVYNLSLSALDLKRDSEGSVATSNQMLDGGATTLAQNEQFASHEQRRRLNLSSRLQWRGEPGEALVLAPFVVLSQGHTQRQAVLTQSVGLLPPPYANAQSDSDNRYSMLRLNGQWNRRLGDTTRVEVRAGLGEARNANQTLRNEYGAAGALLRVIDDESDVRDRSLNATGKLFALVDGEHSIVSGAEFEGTRRAEARSTLQNGEPLLAEFGENFHAATSRFALYAQDEWNPTAHWSAHAGLRWEGIVTTGDQADGSPARNLSNVWSPIVHAVWKPEPASRDQLRMSLTRSYRAPTLQSLIARPSISARYPVPGPNIPTSPDREGNPELRPELATGIDVAIERYLPGGGLFSANLFRRNIGNLIRSVTTLQAVAWANVPRWVAQPKNIGDAVTQGLELEAKFRLTDFWPEALPLDVRANASLFRSRVASVPGPDNRLDQQPPATANLGADYRFRGVPLTLGGSVNWNPAYTTRLSEVQTVDQGRKLVVDANALWVFAPGVQVRLTANNLAPADYVIGGSFDTDTERETTQTAARTYVNWQLRLELRL